MDKTPSQEGMLAGAQLLSIILAYENLIENRAQSAHNDVESANANQANYILEELAKKFDEQNKILGEISTGINELLHFQRYLIGTYSVPYLGERPNPIPSSNKN